ncbi:unnamed protein product [Caenorhabditis auriculariae]|uniref:Metal transporter n=1 Tax=Caenorhabditis auriculariae TaxID=2777116 RepID=A0A8S1GVL4_9PELO|nr:unnamed protein product [Caenorhabditis auriculariae]
MLQTKGVVRRRGLLRTGIQSLPYYLSSSPPRQSRLRQPPSSARPRLSRRAPEILQAVTSAPVIKLNDEHARGKNVIVSGIRLETNEIDDFLGFNERGNSYIKPETEVKVIFYGFGFTDVVAVSFTRNGSCNDGEHIYESNFFIKTPTRFVVTTKFEEDDGRMFSPCIAERPAAGQKAVFTVQNNAHMLISTQIPEKIYYFPLPIQVTMISFLLILSGLFSGLNLGLMSLSLTELQLISKAGSSREAKFAEAIIPIRKKGNFLLCSLLLGNVIVNSAISILLDNITGSGGVALICSSVAIVIVGEIFPQALCVKKGLEVGAKTIWITRCFMAFTAVASYPISLLLDLILGEEVTSFDRKRLVELIKLQNGSGKPGDGELLRDEFRIALGALEIWDKTVSDVMTKIEDVFMLPTSARLNTKLVAEILRMGYTRIPIYEHDRNNVVSLLFVKDLALLDPEDNVSVSTVCNFHQHMVRFVTEDTPLRFLLDEFKKGDYHLAMVHKLVYADDADPSYELVGLITLEDIFEEILQAEIVDETDAVIDNVHRKKRCGRKSRDMSALINPKNPSCVVSGQMQIVAMQWLINIHPIFGPDYLTPSILEKLILQGCRKVETSLLTDVSEPNFVLPRAAKLFTKGEYSDKFVLILEGRALITVGQDGMNFEAGPWDILGREMLDGLAKSCEDDDGNINRSCSSLPTDRPRQLLGFVSDFTAVIRQSCTFVEIHANDWLLAYKSTLLVRRNSLDDKGPKSTNRTISHNNLHDTKDTFFEISTVSLAEKKREAAFLQ